MFSIEPSQLGWVLGCVQVLGLVSAWVARVSVGSRYQLAWQRLFLGSLLVVGASTIVSLGLNPGCWVVSGATMALMVLTVTCDFGHSRRAAAW